MSSSKCIQTDGVLPPGAKLAKEGCAEEASLVMAKSLLRGTVAASKQGGGTRSSGSPAPALAPPAVCLCLCLCPREGSPSLPGLPGLPLLL